MKKNKQYRVKKQTVRNAKRSAKAKKRNYPRIVINGKYVKKYCPAETTRDFEIGPSLVTEVKDGKTVIAKNAIEENKAIKQSKKERIKNILMKAGYDPTIHYTRKEKKKFTRIVKNSLFDKSPKPKERTKAEWKELFIQQKAAKEARMEALKYKPLPIKAGKQKGFTAAELAVKEKPKERKFKYTINRRRSDDDKRTYDFKTDYFTASTRDEAKKKVAKEAKQYRNDSSFAGITVQDIEGDNNIIYYDGKSLLAA
ncbi:MAG: hypothetical protein ACLUUE_00340 [Romboutsia timonensis]